VAHGPAGGAPPTCSRACSTRRPSRRSRCFEAPSRADRSSTRVFEKNGRAFRERAGRIDALPDTISGHAADYAANERRTVFSLRDADEHIRVVRLPSSGRPASTTTSRPRSPGWGGTISSLRERGRRAVLMRRLLGQRNNVRAPCRQPRRRGLRLREGHRAERRDIRRLAATGGDAIIVDDATATRRHESRWRIRALLPALHEDAGWRDTPGGLKAIAVYFGAVMDRLDLRSRPIGADGLNVECSMKGYR